MTKRERELLISGFDWWHLGITEGPRDSLSEERLAEAWRDHREELIAEQAKRRDEWGRYYRLRCWGWWRFDMGLEDAMFYPSLGAPGVEEELEELKARGEDTAHDRELLEQWTRLERDEMEARERKYQEFDKRWRQEQLGRVRVPAKEEGECLGSGGA